MSKPRANIIYDIVADFGTPAQELPYKYSAQDVRKVLKATLNELCKSLDSPPVGAPFDYFPVRLTLFLHVTPPKELQQ